MNVLVDRRADATAAAAGTLERDQTLAERDQTLADRDQTLADRDQTLADRDQTLADADQSASDGDQSAAERDQAAADDDQAAADRDLARGGDPAEHDLTREIRDQSARQREEDAQVREQGAQGRVDTGAERDAVAQARDLAALARDEASALRDRQLGVRDAVWASNGRAVTGAEVLLRAGEYRKLAAADRIAALEGRARAAADREQAARDRDQSARDREHAARDRLEAEADHAALLAQLAIAETDPLTGTRTRAAGLVDLDHEIERARRTTGRLVVGYVDVVGLKAVNDAQGHAAGDEVLRHALRAIREHMRSYDLIVRLGGDEFLCVMSDATDQIARRRFDAVQASLAADADRCQIRVGVAGLEPEDSAAALIERADAELPAGSRR